MSQKKYFWLKQPANFFHDAKIKKLRRMAGGDTYTIIYQKMMLLSISSGGVIAFQGIEQTLYQELALELDEDEINVQATLIYLQSQGLVENISDDEYLLSQVPLLIGSEGDSAERVRKFRENKKKKQLEHTTDSTSLQCNNAETMCNTEKEKEKEKELELELKTEKELKTKKADSAETLHFINEVINSLNYIAGTSFKATTEKTKTLIKARVKEGATLNDFVHVHFVKVADWGDNPDMKIYIRPETLYGNKFEGYLNQKLTNYDKARLIQKQTGQTMTEIMQGMGMNHE